jgi:hypothetical protein
VIAEAVMTPDRRRRRTRINAPARLPLAALVALSAAACGGEPDRTFDATKYSAKVDHALVPLTSVRLTVLEGNEQGVPVRVESRVLASPVRIAGVPVRVVQVREFEHGKLVERTRDYYAQSPAGNVWYFGEHVEDIKDGKVVGHGGQWMAGHHGALPGLFMSARPTVGRTFEQERAPGVAEDRSKVVAVGLDVTTPAGSFSNCIKTEDYSPLDDVTEFKYYCPGLGLVREESPGSRVDLVRYG